MYHRIYNINNKIFAAIVHEHVSVLDYFSDANYVGSTSLTWLRYTDPIKRKHRKTNIDVIGAHVAYTKNTIKYNTITDRI